MNHFEYSIASSKNWVVTGNVRPGTDSVGQPPKKLEIFSASTVALINTTLRSFRCSNSVLSTINRKSARCERMMIQDSG